MASVHRFPGETSEDFKKKDNYSPDLILKTEFELMMAALENPKMDILGHPFGMSLKRFGLRPNDSMFNDVINMCAKKLDIDLMWKGKGFNEVGINKKTKKTLIKIDKKFFRATEVDDLIGDYSKAKKLLKWRPTINIEMLVNEMISHALTIEERSIYS